MLLWIPKSYKSEISMLDSLASFEVSSDSDAAPRHSLTQVVVDESITIFLEGKGADIYRERGVLGMKFFPTNLELILIFKWKTEGKLLPNMPIYLYAVSPTELFDRFPIEEDGKLYIYTPLQGMTLGGKHIKRDAIGGTWTSTVKHNVEDAKKVAVGRKRSFYFDFVKKTQDKGRHLMVEYTMEESSRFALSVVYTKVKAQDEFFLSDWEAKMAAKYNIVLGVARDDRAALPDLNLSPP